MKPFLLFVFSIVFLLPAQAALVHPERDTNTTEIDEFSELTLTLDDIRTLRNREIGEKLGRRLSLGESIALGIIRGRMKRQERREARRARRNARRAERGLPPLDGEVSLSDLWFSLGSLGGFALGVWLAVGTPLFGWILAGISFFGMVFFGGRGRKKYRDTNRLAFWISSVIFFGSSVLVGMGLAVYLIFLFIGSAIGEG